jgi:hypothetical protein
MIQSARPAAGCKGSVRKMTFRGHGAMVGGTTNDMPPPPIAGGRPLPSAPISL